MKKKFKKIFIIISIIFISGLIVAYGIRLVHFYILANKISNGEVNEITTNYFNDILEATINVSDINGGLYVDGDDYVYKYAATNNYLWYSGQLWRIIRINSDKTITMITDESISLLQPKYEEKIYVDEYLEDFYEKLDKDFLVKASYCEDKIDDLKKITCESKKEKNISLLDMYTYNKAGNTKSFLNNNIIFWLITTNSDNNYWYIDDLGAVGVGSENVAHDIRPIVTLKSEINLIKGDGTKENPYIIKENTSEKLDSVLVGEFVKYNNELWKVLNISEKSVSLIKKECLKNEEECLNYKFGTNINFLNSAIYKYLNVTYYGTLENKDFLVKDIFYTGNYENYDYKKLKENIVEAYIGLPKVSDYYIQNNLNSYLITPNIIETIYTINENGNYYLIDPSTEHNIYPIINLDINLKIINGNGTMTDPYEVSR